MKYNLNNYVIGSMQFLKELNDTNYDESLYSDINIYLKPYYHIKQNISLKDWNSFQIFYKQLLNKSDIICENLDDIFITTDIALIYSFIVAVQYYFL